MNRLLERQLKRNGVDYAALPEAVRQFIDDVGRSYDHHDADRALTERSIELSSQELVEANRRLAKEAKNQSVILENLRSAIITLSAEQEPSTAAQAMIDSDPVALSDFLMQQFRRKKEAEDTVRIYEMAVRSTSDGIVISDPSQPDNPIIFCNPAFLQVTGYTAEEVMGKNCRFLQGTDRDQAGLQVIREAIVNKRGCHVRIRNYRKSGEMFWNDFRLSPIFDASHRLKFYIGVQTDVTADMVREQFHRTLSQQRKELMHVAEEVLAAQTEAQVVQVIVERLEHILPFDTAALYTMDNDAHMLRPLALMGPQWTAPNLDEWSIPFGTGIIGSIIAAGKGELVNNAHRDPRAVYPKGVDIIQEHLIVQPVRSGANVWGAFIINRMSEMTFTSDEYEVVQFLTSYASLALQNIHLLQQLSENERTQRTILHTISDGVVGIDDQGSIFFVNEGIEKIFGYDAPSLMGANIGSLVPDRLQEAHRNGFERYGKSGVRHLAQWHEIKLPGRHRDGHDIPLEISFGESSLNGKRIFTGIIRDITERKRAEEILRATSSRLTSLIQTIQAGVLVEDETRHISLINQNFCDLFSIPVPSEQLMGTDCSQAAEQSKMLFADPVAFIERIEQLLRERRVVTNDELTLADGRTFERDYIPIFVADEYKGHMWLYRDITVRKRNEVEVELLSRFPAENPNPVFRVDADFRTLYLNEPALTMLFNVGAEGSAMVPPEWRPIIESIMLKGKPGEFEIVGQHGTPVYLAHFSPVSSTGYTNIYVTDVTERKVAEWEATKAKRLAEESLRAKQDFLAKMSHELRTPMNAVLGLANLLLNTPLSQEQMTLLQGIKSSGANLLVIINDILDLAKIEAGKLTIDRSDVVLTDMLENILIGLRPMAQQKNITLDVRIDPAIPEVIKGDAVRLGQIVINLISNAIKFTHRGSVTLTCSVWTPEGGAPELRLAVTDTGIGIPEHKLQAIFDAFSQASQDIAVRYGGTGLGLTIVQQLVALMKGTIIVESSEGIGSTFTVTLPLEQSTVQRSAAVRSAHSTVRYEALNGTVLLVEDNPANQMVAVKTMALWNIDADVAPDGYAALEMLQQKRYDLVLMDIQMPGMDGFQTTKCIRKELPEPVRSIPIIAMTASVLYDPEARAIAGGMNGYISKPFELEDFYTKLSRFLSFGGAASGQTETQAGTKRYRHLDTGFLESIARDNPTFVRDMVMLFEQNTPKYLGAIREGAVTHDFNAVKRAAHTMKPTGAYIGIAALKPLATELERCAEGRDADGELMPTLQKLEMLCEEIFRDITEWKNDNPPNGSEP